MRRIAYEMIGIILVLTSLIFFSYSIKFLSERDYVAGILQIFVGFSVVRAGLELTKLSLLTKEEQ